MQTRKVFKLDDEKPESPFRLIGIAATIKHYTLCYHLNLVLGIDFLFMDLPPIIVAGESEIKFQVLKADAETGDVSFFMVVNKESGQLFLPEAANYDFVLKISGDADENFWLHCIEKIKSIKGVLIAAEIPLKKIKRFDRLAILE